MQVFAPVLMAQIHCYNIKKQKAVQKMNGFFTPKIQIMRRKFYAFSPSV